MPIDAQLLDSGEDTTDGLSYTTGVIDPDEGSVILVFFHLLQSAVGSIDGQLTVTGNDITYAPVATAVLNNHLPVADQRLACYAGLADSASSGSIQIASAATTMDACAWAVVAVSGVDTTDFKGFGAYSALRQIHAAGAPNGNNVDELVLALAKNRAAGNAVIAAFSHAADEATTADADLTELADEHNADLANIEVAWSDTYKSRPSASWATSGSRYAGIAIELAEPGNQFYVTDPIADLYP